MKEKLFIFMDIFFINRELNNFFIFLFNDLVCLVMVWIKSQSMTSIFLIYLIFLNIIVFVVFSKELWKFRLHFGRISISKIFTKKIQNSLRYSAVLRLFINLTKYVIWQSFDCFMILTYHSNDYFISLQGSLQLQTSPSVTFWILERSHSASIW